jgi:hypothetical protein
MPHLYVSSPSSATDTCCLARLQNAQAEHDELRPALRSGVTARLLAADNQRWEAIGDAIASLARLIARQFAESAFGDARPDTALLAARLSEAIDDLLDEPAWTVIDAAARLAVSTPR